jgi:hypothetical protein
MMQILLSSLCVVEAYELDEALVDEALVDQTHVLLTPPLLK